MQLLLLLLAICSSLTLIYKKIRNRNVYKNNYYIIIDFKRSNGKYINVKFIDLIQTDPEGHVVKDYKSFLFQKVKKML